MSSIKPNEMIKQYRDNRTTYVRLDRIATDCLMNALKEAGIQVMSVEHRVKTVDSLALKVARKGDKYAGLEEITDLVGIRVITYFADDVDRVAELVAGLFDVDWKTSVDKREQLSATSFGYLSLHHICSLKPESGAPEELLHIRFEIQLRSVLQHVWAEIEHDLGYKSEFGVPRAIRREFSRVAGLLEIADESFSSIREKVNKYTEDIRVQIAEDRADDLPIDRVSLREYMLRNGSMRSFLERLAEVCMAEITDADPELYVPQLEWLQIRTLGQLRQMLEDDGNEALLLAEETMRYSELESVSSTAALRYLCQAELLRKRYTCEQMEEFLKLSLKDPARAAARARRLSARLTK